MKLVILDNFAMYEGDLDWSYAKSLATDFESYGYLSREQQLEAVKDAELLIMNKTLVNTELLQNAPKLKYVGIIATGTDNVDLNACRQRGVVVCNVPSYSTYSVAQLTFALLLELCQSPAAFYKSVQDGVWRTGIDKSYKVASQTELCGKTLGVVGYGNIAKTVCGIAAAFGMKVCVYTKTKRENTEAVTFVTLNEMLAQSDVISLHCPATEQTENIICQKNIDKMKDGVILINTARGKLCDEAAVAKALQSGKLGGFGADVLAVEPMAESSAFKTTPNTVITPHIAWATNQALERLMNTVNANLKAFLDGKPQNRAN